MENLCPDEEMLADYMGERLSDNKRFYVEQHLSDCDECLLDFEVTRSLVREGDRFELEGVPEHVTQTAVDLVNSQGMIRSTSHRERLRRFLKGLSSKISDSVNLISWKQWRLSPVRSSRQVISKDVVHIKKTFKDIDADIEVERVKGNKANVRVKLPKHNSVGVGVRVTLIRGHMEIMSHLFDYESDVLFEEVPFGGYSLAFTRNGAKLGTYHFETKGSPNG